MSATGSSSGKPERDFRLLEAGAWGLASIGTVALLKNAPILAWPIELLIHAVLWLWSFRIALMLIGGSFGCGLGYVVAGLMGVNFVLYATPIFIDIPTPISSCVCVLTTALLYLFFALAFLKVYKSRRQSG